MQTLNMQLFRFMDCVIVSHKITKRCFCFLVTLCIRYHMTWIPGGNIHIYM